MELISAQALAVFLLAVLPGAIVLEIVEFRRPHLRERGATRSLARYLLLAAFAWATAFVLADARSAIARAIDVSTARGPVVADAYADLARTVALAAASVGLVARLCLAGIARVGYWLSDRAREGGRGWAARASRMAGIGLSPFYEWDRLLSRLRRTDEVQVAHVRFRDGTSIYGLFAGAGGADFEADGRGLLLDAELAEVGDRLVQVESSSGLYVAPDSIASVSFVARSDLTEHPVESTVDER